MDLKEKNSIKDLDNKRIRTNASHKYCSKMLEELEFQGNRLRNFMELVGDNSATYGKDVLEYYDKEYYEIQKIKKDIFCMGDELEENVQREKNKLNQLEEEIKRNEPKQQHKD